MSEEVKQGELLSEVHKNLLGKKPPQKTSQLELEKKYTYYGCSFLKNRQGVEQSISSSGSQTLPVTAQMDIDEGVIGGEQSDDTEEVGITQLTESRCVRKNLIASGELVHQQSNAGGAKKQKSLPGSPYGVQQQLSASEKYKKRFEFAVIYKKANKKMGVRKFKVIAANEQKDKFQTPELLAKMRKKFGKLIVDSESFDRVVYEKCGRFFNKKFWELNIKWGVGNSYEENLVLIDKFLLGMSSEQKFE